MSIQGSWSLQDTLVLRQGYFKICNGHVCAAVMLDLLVAWQNDEAKRQNLEPMQVFTTISKPDWQVALWNAFGEYSIRQAIKILTERGFVTRRENRHSEWWHRTKEHVVNRDVVIDALRELGEGVPEQLYSPNLKQGHQPSVLNDKNVPTAHASDAREYRRWIVKAM